MRYKFASIASPQKFGYAYNTDAYVSNPQTCGYFRMFETMGDGLIQHTGDWAVTFDHLADYLFSLAAAMAENETMAKDLGYLLSEPLSRSAIEFAASVVWRESDREYSKRRFYSVQLEKIGGRAKEYDKRYSPMHESLDGSMSSILKLTTDGYTHQGFYVYRAAEQIRNWGNELTKGHPGYGDGWPEWFGGSWEKNNDLRNALAACRHVCESYRLRLSAVESLANYRAVVQTRAENAARVAAVAAVDAA